MTALRAGALPAASPRASGIGRCLLLMGALAALVMARRWATVSIASDGIAVGAAFGLGLAALAVAAEGRPSTWVGRRFARAAGPASARSPARAASRGEERRMALPASAAIGLAGAVPLVAIAIFSSGPPIVMFGSAAPFLPWAAATVLVATAEELLLRGAVFAEVDRLLGGLAAVVITSVAFALMHVPLYGWHVVPLDLGVGFWLAGLRLASGRVAAPALAHVAADLVTWWL